ncbi:MAG TPA: acyclic terpene utilization AtuA family protein [Candidatus Limnocylindria bacterium]|nr:acyclic terpene utilization AtuA family protein [Candidatus Limnocylindria bacterium]
MQRRGEVCVMAAAGMMGSSFDEQSFRRGLDLGPDVIGCDSGTCDSGPYYLGAGVARMSRAATKRDLTLMITEGVRRGIPVLVGSAGTSGGDPNVDWMVGIVKEIAAEQGLRFRLAEIKTEITPERLAQYRRAGKLLPLDGAPDAGEEELLGVTRCVSVIGPEPYMKALDGGAQVVIAGRSTDTAIFAAVPARFGLDNAYAWHAAKVLECGSLASDFEIRHGAMLAWVREDSASIEPGHPDMSASPVSVVSHTLYENADPFTLVEPGRAVHTKDSVYEAEDPRRVRITGSEMERRPYTVKVEAAKFEGYRRVAVGGVADPLILRQFGAWLEDVLAQSRDKIRRGLGLEPGAYRLRHLVYGDPENPAGKPVGVVFDILADTPERAEAIITNVWHTALHVPVRDWRGAQSQVAFPFSPPTLQPQNGGETYSYCLNHVLALDDPLETSRITYHDL